MLFSKSFMRLREYLISMIRRADETSRPALNAPYVAKKYLDRGRNTVFLKNRDFLDSRISNL